MILMKMMIIKIIINTDNSVFLRVAFNVMFLFDMTEIFSIYVIYCGQFILCTVHVQCNTIFPTN